jgi:hypothetical protein
MLTGMGGGEQPFLSGSNGSGRHIRHNISNGDPDEQEREFPRA